MSNRAHIVELDSPLKGAVTAVCGLNIEKPNAVFLWDESAMCEPLVLSATSGRLCRKCVQAGFSDKRYVYGVVSQGEKP